MILVCELIRNDGAHVPFNAGLLATIRAAFRKEEISFFGGAAHIEELKEQLGQPLASSIAWSEILPIPPGTPYGVRFFRELSVIRRLFSTLPQVSTSRLLFTSCFSSTVLALKAARCFRSRKHTPVQMVFHGLSGVVGKRHLRPIHRFKEMKTALTLLGNNGIQYLVLEKSIRDTVVKNLPLLSGKIAVLEHPICPNESVSQTVDFSEPIRFGFLGLASEIKCMTGSSSRIVHATLPQDDPTRRRPDIGKARQHFGWEPHVLLEQGLTETIKYFKKLLSVSEAMAVR